MMVAPARGWTRCGHTLAELVVVVGIIGILVGLALPAIQKARESASRIQCLNNLRQIGNALHDYEAAHGRLPPWKYQPSGSTEPEALLSWMAMILPEMEQQPLWALSVKACQEDPNPSHNPPHVGNATVIPAYVCPTDGRLTAALLTSGGELTAFTSYIAIGGTIDQRGFLPGVLFGNPGIRLTNVTDGTSQTIMVSERPPPASLQAGRWYTPWGNEPYEGPDISLVVPYSIYHGDPGCELNNVAFGPGSIANPCDRFHLWSLHPGGANFLFADGSARFLPYAAAPIVPALASRSGGEMVEVPTD
jgi:prepilin-type processing-associated H-X9-DG protein